MALSIWKGEILADLGHLGMEKSVSFAVVQAEMGDGAHAAVTVGSVTGVRRWKLRYEALFDDLPMIQARRAEGSTIETPQPRTEYLYRFISRRFQNFDDEGLYFWIFDVLDRMYYAARFEDYALAYSQVQTARQWTTGLAIVEVRMAGSPAYPYTGAPVEPPNWTPIIDPDQSPREAYAAA